MDKFSWGEIERVNPEQPAAPLVKIIKETCSLGGAANVANNIISLNAKCDLYSVIGKDASGNRIKKLCRQKKINFKYFYNNSGTLVKQRIMAHGQQITRADYGEENLEKINISTQNKILKKLKTQFKETKYDAVILSDYNKQIFSGKFSHELIKLFNKYRVQTFVDPKPKNIDYFKNCALISPNKTEASLITGIKYSKDSLNSMGKVICERLNSQYSIITCSENGVFVYRKDGKSKLIGTNVREVSNPTGAGDTFLATLTLSMLSGASLTEACEIANYASGVVVEKAGTATLNIEELIERIKFDN